MFPCQYGPCRLAIMGCDPLCFHVSTGPEDWLLWAVLLCFHVSTGPVDWLLWAVLLCFHVSTGPVDWLLWAVLFGPVLPGVSVTPPVAAVVSTGLRCAESTALCRVCDHL